MPIDEKKEEKNSEWQENTESRQEKSSWVASTGLFFLELIKIVILAGITIGLVRYFLFKPFYVKGQSMEPNYHEKDYLIIDEISYRFREPQRGEVIVFKAPVGNDYYLKRVIGLPGERVKIENNKVFVSNIEHPRGLMLEENYLTEKTAGVINVNLGPTQYFVMGDNRTASYDSRSFGPIDQSSIVGRTWFRGWPPDKVGVLQSPMYKNN